jgi:hypothetical protein
MSQTIPGGAYQNADGSWVNANGRPLSSRAVQQYEALQAEKHEALQRAEQNVLLSQLAPLPPLVNAPRTSVTAVTPPQPPTSRLEESEGSEESEESQEPEEAEQEIPAKPRRGRGK